MPNENLPKPVNIGCGMACESEISQSISYFTVPPRAHLSTGRNENFACESAGYISRSCRIP